MTTKDSIFSPIFVAFDVITSEKLNGEYLRSIQASKSTLVASVAQTGNASICLSHSSEPWILDSRAFYHLSSNKDIFSSLTFTSPLPMVTLTNGSQTIVKGIGSAYPLPSLPLTFIFYFPDSPFNLISINMLTRDLNCFITFSDNSVTLQYQSMGMMIGIGHEFKGLYHLSSPSSSTACTSTDTPLLIHSCLGHPNISSFGKWFFVCPQLSVSRVNLGNILVSHSQSAQIKEQSLLSSLSTLMFGVLPGLILPYGSRTLLLL